MVRKVGKYSLKTDELLDVYENCADAARNNPGCYSNLISKACNGLQSHHKGFKWRYIE